jgi:D-aminopeptidase
MTGPDDLDPERSDTPAADRIWEGLVAWIGGTFVVCGTAIAISAALGWPRRAAAELAATDLAFLVMQAVACTAFIVRSGWRISRRYLGAIAVAFVGGLPAALAVFTALEWRTPSSPAASWGHLLGGAARFAAIEALPVGLLLRMLALGRTAVPVLVLCAVLVTPSPAQQRARARDLGIAPGTLAPGPLNAITDVAGVLVGHTTVRLGDSVRTGVTAIRPHGGNLFLDRVPAAIRVGNGFGKLLGVTQVAELGELETPILLTCTLCVWKAADAMVAWLLAQPGMADVRSINPVVGETNDGYVLNAIRSRPITERDVRGALERAASGPVAEGSVGAGAGTVAFGWKGGIGTASRRTVAGDSAWTVGVLVQSNFGGDLLVLGAPVGRELGRQGVRRAGDTTNAQGPRGSIMIVVATDAPLSDRNLDRLAARALVGLARTGSVMGNGSGDYVVAFSTHAGVRRRMGAARLTTPELGNDQMTGLFQGAAEATEEAIYNSLFMATTVTAKGGTVEALPVPEVLRILRAHGLVRGDGP